MRLFCLRKSLSRSVRNSDVCISAQQDQPPAPANTGPAAGAADFKFTKISRKIVFPQQKRMGLWVGIFMNSNIWLFIEV